MTDTDPTQCPECGWTGDASELDGEGNDASCPICEQDLELIE